MDVRKEKEQTEKEQIENELTETRQTEERQTEESQTEESQTEKAQPQGTESFNLTEALHAADSRVGKLKGEDSVEQADSKQKVEKVAEKETEQEAVEIHEQNAAKPAPSAHPFLNEELEKLRLELEADEAEAERRRPKREKAVPGVRIGRHFYTNEQAKRLLLYGGCGAAALLLCIGLLVHASGSGFGSVGRAATASVAEATPSDAEPESLSPEEAAALERQQAVDAELATYTDLGVVDTSGYINLRSQPNSVDMTNIIGKLSGGAACEILSTDGDWSLISSGGIQGYVYNQYVKTGEEAKQLAEENIAERAVISTDVLNIRSAPEVDPENVVGKARRNERYKVLSVDGNWAKIRAELTNGVNEAYINIADGNAVLRLCLDAAQKLDLREMALTQFDNLVVSNTDGYINIRETPSAGSIDNICGKFPAHAGAELLETTEAEGRTWYKIRSGNVTGYVSAEFCATGNAAKDVALEGAVLTAFVRTDALNVRSEPSTDSTAWTQVTKNQAYHVLDQLDGWVQIELDSSDDGEESDKAYISTRDNNVEVKYGLPEAVEYYPAVEAANAAMAFRNEIVNYACQFVGNPYVWGGTSLTNGADCSGFTMKVLEHFGISIPRVSRDQARAGVKVTSDQMKPGDLVFYANRSGVINHVGMYIGNGQVVNAASRRSGIRIYRWNYRTPVAIRNVIGA